MVVKGVMPGLYPGASASNLKSIALTVLELLAFNHQNLEDHMTLATPPFLKK